MNKFDFRLLLTGAVDSRSVVYDYLDNRRLMSIDDISFEKLLVAIQDPEYFPDFTESNGWPENLGRDDISDVRAHVSENAISQVVINYKKIGGKQDLCKTSRTPREFASYLSRLLKDEKVIFKSIYGVRRQFFCKWVFNLEPLSRTPLDTQLSCLSGEGWSCDWVEVEPTIWEHEKSKYRVTFS